ncbi:hypothetical protein L6452_37430 [Arctium lappa]|uniref:Uncharacterized protein n=1 Tax=Arctium lappa TaxID=4217 RepID=A0ACB8Y749_ARCLA|nr:hypothetical protein L6452_37430 [Arctium lappa]
MTSREALVIGTDTRPPVLFKGEYEQWKDRFLNFVDKHELGDFLRKSIEEGVMKPVLTTRLVGTVPTQVELKYHELEDDNLKRAKEMWDQLEKMMMGSKVGNQLKISNFLNNYEEFRGRVGETLEETYDRFVTLQNEQSKNKVTKSQIELNVKFLSILQPEWKRFARQMKQIKDLNEISLDEVYETLRQNEEELDEILDEKMQKGKTVEDTVALVVRKKKNKTIVYDSEENEAYTNSDSDENDQLKQAMLLLTNDFQKKFYKKPTSNSQRYSSAPNNYVHKERVEGNRYEGKRTEERKPKERRYQSEGKRIEERKPEERKYKAEGSSQSEPPTCYNCGKTDEDDEDEERDEAVNMCLMGKQESDDEADSEEDAKDEKLSDEIPEKKVLVEVLHRDNDTNAKEKTIILKENSELKSKLKKSELDFYELTKMHSSCIEENKTLIAKLKGLEEKLYKLGQTEQTIHLNKPKEEIEEWGIGYKNPQCLQKEISEVPALYDHLSLKLARRIPEFKTFWTRLSEKDEADETEKHLKSSKVHLPFYYAKMNNSYNENPIYQKNKSLSNDFFQSYSEKEMEAKPIQGKLYVPPLVLESKISELENSLSDERLLMNIEQKVFSIVLKNYVLSNASNSEDMFGSSNKGFDFLNSNGGSGGCFEQFDFNSKLPNHSSFVQKIFGKTSMPVNSAKLTKVDNSISVKAKIAKGKIISKHSQKLNTTIHSKKKHSFVDQKSNSRVSHVSDLSKQRPEVKSLWQPKQKLDKTVKSFCSINCSKTSPSKDVLIADVAILNSKLVVSRKQYTMKQLFQLSLSARKSSIYDKHVSTSCQDSEDWFGNHHIRHLWYLDSGCSKHMTGQKEMLSNFKDKYCGPVKFGNDQHSPIMGYGDMVQNNVTIKKVSYVEGLKHNLFSIGQFCDKDLEVNFKAKTCSVSTEKGEELLVETRKYINNLVSGKLVKGLPELKYEREHLCAACEKGKMKRDKTPDVLITFLKTTQVNLQKPVKLLRTDNGTEFKNKKVEEYLEFVGI